MRKYTFLNRKRLQYVQWSFFFVSRRDITTIELYCHAKRSPFSDILSANKFRPLNDRRYCVHWLCYHRVLGGLFPSTWSTDREHWQMFMGVLRLRWNIGCTIGGVFFLRKSRRPSSSSPSGQHIVNANVLFSEAARRSMSLPLGVIEYGLNIMIRLLKFTLKCLRIWNVSALCVVLWLQRALWVPRFYDYIFKYVVAQQKEVRYWSQS